MTQRKTEVSHYIGWWDSESEPQALTKDSLRDLFYHINQSFFVLETPNGPGFSIGKGSMHLHRPDDAQKNLLPVIGFIPACRIESLGDPFFRRDWNIRHAFLGGSMANGISSINIVTTLARAGMIGFYGAAGQDIGTVEQAVMTLKETCGNLPWGVNLIHSPQEALQEDRMVDLFLRTGVRHIEASAYMTMTRALVRFRLHGIHRDKNGTIIAPNQILAKASRVEIARKFFSPAPEALIRELLSAGLLTETQAEIAALIPIAQDITAEADSGGHTDNRPLVTLLPSFQAVARDCMETFGYSSTLRVGAAGGISTPASAAAAFAMGASWIMSGSIVQAAVESGTSDFVRRMLAEVEQAEITMAPAADMFEMGVNLQVLKRGTFFPMRAKKLYDLYREYDAIDAIPPVERASIEKNIFRAPLEQIWEETRAFWIKRDPSQAERAGRDPKHKMALVFRWYLGLSSRWANAGDAGRKLDYQVWCGPAMGAFNQWVRGSFLDDPEQRRIQIMLTNILWGAAVIKRLSNLQAGLPAMLQPVRDIRPQSPESLQKYLGTEEVQQ